MSSQEILMIVKELSTAAISTIFSGVGSILKDVISLYYIGHLNEPILLAAAGFGLTWANSFGTAIIAGFAGGFGTLASQAFGAKNYHKLGVLYQKCLVVMMSLLLLISILLWFTRAELMMFGFDPELATKVGQFIRYLLLDLFFVMIFEITKYYLFAQNIFQVPAYILFISTTGHIFWSNLFINVLGWDLTGMAFARTITDGTSALLIFLYIKLANPCPESWFPWVSECLQELVSFGKTIGSHGSALYFEWIAFELSTIIVGYLGNIDVIAAHSSAQNYLFVNGAPAFGLIISTSIFVGNAAGEGSLHKAQKYAYVGFISNFILVSLLDLLLICFVEEVASFYTNEPNVKAITVTMLTVYFFGMFGDLICNTLAAILRVLGEDRFVLKGFLWSYYGVGLSCSLIFGVWLGFGYYGVWISLVLGFYVMLVISAIKLKKLDWEKAVHKVSTEHKRKSFNEVAKLETEMHDFV